MRNTEGFRNAFSLGYIPDAKDSRDYLARAQLQFLAVSLPQAFSWRTRSTGVRDQGNLGACVGFACAGLKEFQETMQRKRTPYMNVSEMWIYWKAKKIDPWPSEEGTSIRCALKVLCDTGVPTERAWEYTDKKAAGNKPPTRPLFWAAMIARWGKVSSSYYRLTGVNEIRRWLFLNGPVVIGLPVGESIFAPVAHGGCPGNSFVTIPRSFIGGHAILLTGYDDNHRVFRFKNSWSEQWGHSGYGSFSYDYLANVDYDAWAISDAI